LNGPLKLPSGAFAATNDDSEEDESSGSGSDEEQKQIIEGFGDNEQT